MLSLTSLLFIGITCCLLYLFYRVLPQPQGVNSIVITWVAMIGLIAACGFFQMKFGKLPALIFLFPCILAFVVFLIAKVDTRNTTLYNLLWFHVLRIPVEIGLFLLFKKKMLPIEMTFLDRNWDIVVGLSALLMLFWHKQTGMTISKKIMIGWNIMGILFLMHIVTVAILSTPTPIQQFGFTQPNVAVLQFPYIFLPAIIVPFVFSAHVWSLKKLKRMA